MVDDAAAAGCECAKFQSHVIEDEMIPNNVIPGNAKESIWDIMKRCALTESEETELKRYVEAKGLIYLCTPCFSRAAAVRLESMGVAAYKIGSGECNNYPLIAHIAAYGKPVILSTGMNNLESVAAGWWRFYGRRAFPSRCCIAPRCIRRRITRCGWGRSGRSKSGSRMRWWGSAISFKLRNYACLAAVAVGASILEKHFTSDLSWPGPDVPISMDPAELRDLVEGSRAAHQALGGSKDILPEEEADHRFRIRVRRVDSRYCRGRRADDGKRLGEASGHR